MHLSGFVRMRPAGYRERVKLDLPQFHLWMVCEWIWAWSNMYHVVRSEKAESDILYVAFLFDLLMNSPKHGRKMSVVNESIYSEMASLIEWNIQSAKGRRTHPLSTLYSHSSSSEMAAYSLL